MPAIRGSYDEETANVEVIASLAEETHQPMPIVKEVYEAEFARLKSSARLTDYLVLFACRRTRDALAPRRA